MLSWHELSQQIQQSVNGIVRVAKTRKREEAAIGLAAFLFWIGYSFSKWLSPELKDWVNSWRGLLIIPGVLYTAGAVFVFYGLYRIWQLVQAPDLPPPRDRPSAIKGPIAFTPADGELFRRLGRENELGKLLGFVEDDQVRMVVLMGASGAGKTSLLRAGLTNILRNKGIEYHYWEALPTTPGRRLLRAIQETWETGAGRERDSIESLSKPESLEDLVNPSSTLGGHRHVIVLDQFEQLHGSTKNNSVLRLLRKVAREAKPPHRVTWIVAFRREFRAEWEDFTLPEKEHGIHPAEISLRLFTADQARDVISQLIDDAELSIQQKVVDNLVAAATVDGEVSPVDIGIGLLVLAELHDRQGGETVTLDAYQFAGGAEGLLTQYISRCLDLFPEADRPTMLNTMLALREPGTNQRIAEGRTYAELAHETRADAGRLKTQLERLTQRDMRLLEILVGSGEGDTRYRLPHERLIPALHRMAGQLLAEVDQTRLRFENAFSAWKNSSKEAQYLLKAGELRLVERYEGQIPWGKDALDKRAFLRRSQRRRALGRSAVAAVLLLLLAAGWVGKRQYQRYDAQIFLRDNNYPFELYDWQHQLKTLGLNDEVNTQRFPWPQSQTLGELQIKALQTANSLDGLGDLARCQRLKELTLDLSGGRVHDLTPLTKLTGLTDLVLDISLRSDVEDLTPLTKLTRLTKLTLILGGDSVRDLTPLTKLTGLKHLLVSTRGGGSESDLTPLAKLTGLTKMNLDVSGSEFKNLIVLMKLPALTDLTIINPVSDLTPLMNFPALTHLNLWHSEVGDLTPLINLPALTHLTLDLSSSQVKDLTPLTKLRALTELNLDLTRNQETDLTPLAKLSADTQLNLKSNDLKAVTKLPALKHLDLALSYDDDKDLTPLMGLPALTYLNLTLSGSKVIDLTPLTKLTALEHLGVTQYYVFEASDVRPRDLDSLAIDLTPLTKLTGLRELNLDVSGRMPPPNLTALTELNLRVSGHGGDLTPLAKLTALRKLDLDISQSDVRDLMPLTMLTELSQLSLKSGSNISDLAPLTKLSALNELTLDIRRTQVKDLTPLAKLSCKTLMLSASADQRLTLKAIPRSVIHLEF